MLLKGSGGENREKENFFSLFLFNSTTVDTNFNRTLLSSDDVSGETPVTRESSSSPSQTLPKRKPTKDARHGPTWPEVL